MKIGELKNLVRESMVPSIMPGSDEFGVLKACDVGQCYFQCMNNCPDSCASAGCSGKCSSGCSFSGCSNTCMAAGSNVIENRVRFPV